MHLNIKSDQAHRMAQELSHLTGENLTQAVIKAIAERLERERIQEQNNRKGISTGLQELADKCVALPLLDNRHPDDILYDENGLSRRDTMQ